MGQTGQFDYFYGMQADTYSFYRIPKILFTDQIFRILSCEAKVLYGLMLDRMSLSIKNKWFDEQGRVYIIFTVQDVRDYLGCCRQTAINLLAELDCDKGIGLIEKKRLGFGKANIIYVKNFATQEEAGERDSEMVRAVAGESDADRCVDDTSDPEYKGDGEFNDGLQEAGDTGFLKYENHTSRSPENRLQEVQNVDFKKSKKQTSVSLNNRLLTEPEEASEEAESLRFDASDDDFQAEMGAECVKTGEFAYKKPFDMPDFAQAADPEKSGKQTSRSLKNRLQEVQNVDFKKYENHTSESPENRLQEVQKTDRNKTNSNNTEKNETESYQSHQPIYPSNQSIHDRLSVMRQEMDDEMETRMAYRELIHENIEYEALCSMYGKERIDEVVTLMLDTVCTTRSKLLINGDAVSAEWVRSRLLKLDYFHIQYVLNCLDSNTTKVRNIRQYMLTALYNAISTMNHYYTAEVNHNMYGDGPA